ncbi:septation protein SepH [Cumulibacter soli]|uniref:septation protein SepH n=1 Tax=Cumulibacter soli TaxID=2546344 RepID=UPI0010672012|nr:septation protein SepH [Cumulibacter soli]
MRPLRFIALSEDGKNLVLAPDVPEAIDNGERFLLALDDRLRAAARGDLSRLGQIEIEIESQLRPREIQARIRAGETPDTVAAAAGVRIERVMTYAHPVLQERAQVAVRAQSARVKIEDSGSAHPPTLAELIESRLLVRAIEDTTIDWDARRLESGQWEVTSTWVADDRTITAHWRYDMQNSIIYPGSKDTIELIEPKPRLAAVPVPTDDPSLDDERSAAAPIPLQRPRDDSAAKPRPARRAAATRDPQDLSLDELFLAEEFDDAVDPGHLGNASRRPELTDDDVEDQGLFAQAPATPEDEDEPPASMPEADDSEQPAAATPKGDKKPRIPSWDDIVFGVKKRK